MVRSDRNMLALIVRSLTSFRPIDLEARGVYIKVV